MPRPCLTIGLIGYQFMGRAHSNAYRQVGRFFDLPVEIRMKTVCGRHEAAVREAAQSLGWEGFATDYRQVLEDPEIDVVDIATPGDSHCEIAVAAAQAGKAVWCEKPIGNTLAEAKRMAEAVRASGRPSAVFHNYRFAPAVALAKKLLESGRLGRIYHFRAVYLQDWIADPAFPMVWRLRREHAGSGALGDIGSHIIDLARHLVGEFAEVCGTTETFISERPDGHGGTGTVDVDDAAVWLARFQGGALGSFEASRFALGRKNQNRFEINGSGGSIVFDLERMNELQFFDASDPAETAGFRLLPATQEAHPYAGHYWPVGHILGYEHTFVNLIAEAAKAHHEGRRFRPDLEDGLQNQRVLDAVERSHHSRGWVSLDA
ncbi:MAG: Gfo/Idh/MocA family oxidoreductase [Fimbriimonadaceae bacterium]|nr:Gfo/Idh/MocA family oxidoreductase [Fimbriimonadaceae bacterium]QYK55076.1 MAG: Gfo/Idh/MocA family oxidoreductase [Fimbriimonadaceae bacterium]